MQNRRHNAVIIARKINDAVYRHLSPIHMVQQKYFWFNFQCTAVSAYIWKHDSFIPIFDQIEPVLTLLSMQSSICHEDWSMNTIDLMQWRVKCHPPVQFVTIRISRHHHVVSKHHERIKQLKWLTPMSEVDGRSWNDSWTYGPSPLQQQNISSWLVSWL